MGDVLNKRSDAPPAGGARDAHCVIFLGVVTALVFRKALFTGGVILSHPVFLDMTHQFYPWRLFGFNLLRRGEIPLWNPYLFCGTPFVANWHSAIFYPFNLIFLIMPVHLALNWSIAFHFFLAGALTYAYVRYLLGDRLSALLSALAFTFSGAYIIQIFPGHVFNPLPWLPLSFLLAERAVREKRMRCYVLGGIILALQVLAGHPQYMLYCFGALLLYFLFRGGCACYDEKGIGPAGRIAAGIALLIVAGFCLSAVQLLPSLEYARFSSRALLKGPASVRELSLPPENLFTLVVPGFWGDMQGARYWGRWLFWETCLYVGIAPLLLAVVGACVARRRHAYFFAVLAVVSLLLALGAYSPLFEFLYYHVPGFNLFRGQAKFIALTAFSLSVLAGYGLGVVKSYSRSGENRLGRIAVVILTAAGVVLLICLILSAGGGEHSPFWQQLLRYREARGFEGTPPLSLAEGAMAHNAYRVTVRGIAAAGILMGLTGAALLAVARGALPSRATGILFVAVALADLWYFGARYIMTSPLAVCSWPPGLSQFLKTDRSIFRICTPNIAIPGATQNMNDAISAIDGYETVNVGAYKEYVDFSQGRSSAQRLDFAIQSVTPMLEALNLKYVILPAEERFLRGGYRLRLNDGRECVYERDAVSPRAYVAHEMKIVPDSEEMLRELAGGDCAERGVVFLGADPGMLLPAMGKARQPSAATIIADEPRAVTITAKLSRPGFLVLSDVYYPGWKAYAGGRERRIYRANHAFRAVYLEEGDHTVRFIYEPASFRYGARVSLAASFVVGFYLLVCVVRRRPLNS